ncbi:MAG: coproporphyrinogen dehydrogenase HemZ [Clostridia bacterium]|nr:coproporphyrinogen dehydrogenase HemZ [Clostridia bacterium]
MNYRVRLVFQQNDYLNDAQDIPRAFSPILMIDEESSHFLEWKTQYVDGQFYVTISSDLWADRSSALTISEDDPLLYKRKTKRFLKSELYNYLSKQLGIELPYGSLTGVRPTKLFYELKSQQKDPFGILTEEFKVSPKRAKLISDCVSNQAGVINTEPDAVAIFVNIPFCPTRCSYCSFISTEVGRIKKELPFYVKALVAELENIKELIALNEKRVTSIYVGGGTPGSIGPDNLDAILRPLAGFGVEFTVEAGRPDTINQELADVLSKNNVSRISINPQTFKQKTLDEIGRKHTIDSIYSAYNLSKGKFFVNMDLIAGLPGENLQDLSDSLDKTIELRPENITVHSLSLKRGSAMTLSGVDKVYDGKVKEMMDCSMDRLLLAGYAPYYLYRQKNTFDNLENVGYCRSGRQCKYNIDMMEEAITVLGAGAGAMTKIICDGMISRFSNPKGFREYIERQSEIIEKKNNFFK